MKRDAATATAIAMLLLAAPLCASEPPFEQARDFAFIEQRGGLKIGKLYRKNNRWQLPVECNVSGIKTISTHPQVIHSGLAWSRSIALVEDNHIYLTIMTAVQGNRAPSAACGPATLSRLRDTQYEVYYRDSDGTTHALGTASTRDR